jgi:hypothetical protein
MTEELIGWVLLLGAAGLIWILAIAVSAEDPIKKKEGSAPQPRIGI